MGAGDSKRARDSSSKKEYAPPRLKTHGTIEKITKGKGLLLTDALLQGSLIV